MESPSQRPLADCFSDRLHWSTHRSSAVFPVRLRQDTDTVVTFLNYWRIKNKLQQRVDCRFRVFASTGALTTSKVLTVSSAHHEHSMRALLGDGDFDGMVEVEFVSEGDLKFAFPAVTAFYRSGSHYASVHGSGRIRNDEEAKGRGQSRETNWTCKYSADIVPFFHIFKGPGPEPLGPVRIELHAWSGALLASRTRHFGLDRPYSSRLVFADEVFDPGLLAAGPFFISLTLPDGECFPRMVVGNYHRPLEFLETGHSFYWTEAPDFLQETPDVALLSCLTALKVPELRLRLVSYPTNAVAQITAKLRSAPFGQALRAGNESLSWETGGERAPVWIMDLDDREDFVCLDFRDAPVPARINTSFQYSVKGCSASPFSVDIATGAHAHVYPPKFTHWGPGLVSCNYRSVLLVRNVRQQAGSAATAEGTLHLYSHAGEESSRAITIPPETACAIELRHLLPNDAKGEAFSWLLNTNCPDLETYWLSFAADGSICGDHGF